ncbi:hypothetical protein D3C76_488850 [compost metagenome]
MLVIGVEVFVGIGRLEGRLAGTRVDGVGGDTGQGCALAIGRQYVPFVLVGNVFFCAGGGPHLSHAQQVAYCAVFDTPVRPFFAGQDDLVQFAVEHLERIPCVVQLVLSGIGMQVDGHCASGVGEFQQLLNLAVSIAITEGFQADRVAGVTQ